MITILVLGILLIGVAIILAYLSKWEAPAVAFAAIILGKISGMAEVTASTLTFWGIAALIAVLICLLLPNEVRNSRAGLAFFCTGALAGALIGLILNSSAAIIIGCSVGVILSAFAFGNMKAGKQMGFPSKKFFNYLLAKGLPVIVTFSMSALMMAWLMAAQTSN